MAFINVGLLTRAFYRQQNLPPVRYNIVGGGKSCAIKINAATFEKCKFKGAYCRLLFDADTQTIRIETCKDPYEAGAYKWQVRRKNSAVASLECVFPPEGKVALPRNNYVISKFIAMANLLQFELLATDVVPPTPFVKGKK